MKVTNLLVPYWSRKTGRLWLRIITGWGLETQRDILNSNSRGGQQSTWIDINARHPRFLPQASIVRCAPRLTAGSALVALFTSVLRSSSPADFENGVPRCLLYDASPSTTSFRLSRWKVQLLSLPKKFAASTSGFIASGNPHDFRRSRAPHIVVLEILRFTGFSAFPACHPIVFLQHCA